VDASGNPHYIAWYEWWVPVLVNLPPGTPTDSNGYPLSWLKKHPYINQTNIMGFDVVPGDEIIASVVYYTNNMAGVSLGNNRTCQTVLFNLAPPLTATFNGSSRGPVGNPAILPKRLSFGRRGSISFLQRRARFQRGFLSGDRRTIASMQGWRAYRARLRRVRLLDRA
jgi:hypothetical protein